MKKAAIVMVMVAALLCVFLVGCSNPEDGKVSDTNTSTSTTNKTNTTTNNTNNNNKKDPR